MHCLSEVIHIGILKIFLVSNNENTSSEVKISEEFEIFLEILKNIDNDIQTRAISKSLAIVQGDLTTLPANMAISSARGTTFFYIKAVFSFESRPNTI